MKWIRHSLWVITAMATITACLSTSVASAEGIEIGGKTAITGNFSVTTISPQDFFDVDINITIVYVGTSITRTTESGRWEYGAGLTIGIFDVDVGGSADSDDSITVGSYTPTLQVRVNTDLLGAEENFLLYAGLVAGVSFLDFNSGGGDANSNIETLGAFGPKFGIEYYFSSRFGVQLEDVLVVDTLAGVTNSLSLGVKVLF
jgi:hypothetical protein